MHLLHREGRYASVKARAFPGLTIERLRADPALNEAPTRAKPVFADELAMRALQRPQTFAGFDFLPAIICRTASVSW